MGLSMKNLQNEISNCIVELKELQSDVNKKEENIRQLGLQLLNKLRILPGWEILIHHLPPVYMKNPDLIFTRGYISNASMYYDKNKIYWASGYSDGTDFVIIEINLNKSLEEQISEAISLKSRGKYKKDLDEFNKDMETYQKIKDKYGL